MKPRHLWLAVALTGAAALALFGDRTSETDISEPTHITATSAVSTASSSPRTAAPASTHTETIRPLLKRETLYGTGQNKAPATLFANRDWTPPPITGHIAAKQQPTAPPLPYIYLGKKIEDGVCEVYLGRGEQSLIVREKTVIDGTWRVDKITFQPPTMTMTITYLPLNQAQLLNIGGTD